MKITRKVFAIAISVFALHGLAACDKKGAAEDVGEKIDEAVEEVGDEIDDATDN